MIEPFAWRKPILPKLISRFVSGVKDGRRVVMLMAPDVCFVLHLFSCYQLFKREAAEVVSSSNNINNNRRDEVDITSRV